MRSLTELKDWLLENGITHVVVESTGVYWKSVYHILEPSGINGLDCQCPTCEECTGT
jgi:hypothetical protein